MKKTFAISILTFLCTAVAAHGQILMPVGNIVRRASEQAATQGSEKTSAYNIQPRVAGLENDSLYMSLLKEEMLLRTREDSLTKAVTALRTQLQQDAANRSRYSASILDIEGQIFEIRNNIGKIASQTGAIEQEFIIKNLTGNWPQAVPLEGSEQTQNIEDISAFLSANPYFEKNLPAEDYKALREADMKESEVTELLQEFDSHYGTLSEIAREYMLTDSAAIADSLWVIYDKEKKALRNISDNIGNLETFIADNKSYSYMYLLDLMNRQEAIEQFNEKSMQANDAISRLDGDTESNNVAAYPIRKGLTLYYEQSLARMLGLSKALDSLSRAEDQLNSINFNYPPILLEERLFLDYDSITIHSPSLYTATNPIPPLKVYDKGTIYRIMLGSFSRAQPVSIFRGAYPLGVLRDDEGRYNYYAGGFATKAEADAAVEQMKKVGFRAPKVALWDYGDYSLPDEENQEEVSDEHMSENAALFRVNISGVTNDLPEAVKKAITEYAPGKDIIRTNTGFVVGSFATDGEAEKLADIIRNTENTLTISVSEISTDN